MIFAVANDRHLAIFCASGGLMLIGSPVKGLGALDFQVQKRQVGNRYVSGIVPLVVLMVAGAFSVKPEFMLCDVCDFALAAFAFSACVHDAFKLWARTHAPAACSFPIAFF